MTLKFVDSLTFKPRVPLQMIQNQIKGRQRSHFKVDLKKFPTIFSTKNRNRIPVNLMSCASHALGSDSGTSTSVSCHKTRLELTEFFLRPF